MATRRAFLQQSGLALPGLLLLGYPLSARAATPASLPLSLFFDADRLPTLQSRFESDPLFDDLRERLSGIDRAAERAFMDGVRTNDHLFDLLRLHNIAPQMAFLYAMTGDEDAADLAASAIRTIMRFPKWDYFLEAGTDVVGIQRASGSVVAVATGVDWLGDYISPEERTAWLRTMGARGCEACFRSIYGMRYKDRVVGWTMDESSTYFEHRPGDRIDLSNWPTILDRTNLKAVPASALAIGAVAYERHLGPDDDTARWLEQATYSVSSFGDLYARDGSYDENISYANYTSLHLAQATEVIRRHQGVDLYDRINWPGFADFALEMTLPTQADPHAVVNFGDAGSGMQSAVPFWIAARSHDAQAQWFGQAMAREHDVWSLIWHDAAVPAAAPASRPHLWRSDLDWIVGRTGYTPDDLVVAMRSGGPANHEHADRNSIIVKAFGEVLVADPYRPPYSFSDPAWMMRTTAGHSALLIDGQGHQYHDGSEGTNPSDAVARLIRTGERDGYLYWASDATPAYRLVIPDVQSVTRTVLMLYGVPAVIVLDKVIKRATPSHLQARFFAFNKDDSGRVEATPDGFKTTRPNAVLLGHAAAAGGVATRAEHLPVPEETALQHPYAQVATQEARLDPLLATVLLPAPASGTMPTSSMQWQPDGSLVIEMRHGQKTARCTIIDSGTLPEFNVDPG